MPPRALSDFYVQRGLLSGFIEQVASFRTDPKIDIALSNFMHTIVGDYDHSLSKSIPNLSSQYDCLLGWDEESSLNDDEARRSYTHALRNRVGTTTFGRRFCISSNGRFGLVPPSTREGDILCVLSEGPSVYVFRRMKGQARYILVGEAYLHGYMMGEAMAEISDGKWKRMEFEIW